MKSGRLLSIILAILLVSTLLSSCFLLPKQQSFDLSNIPNYSGEAYVAINDNKPSFSENEITTTAYEKYSELDFWGRCGVAIASCGKELMPATNEERESISSVTPSGWIQAEYDFISGRYLYNRCHLIGWQLTAENANEKNLIAGTRYLNIEGMLPFENMVADYIKETGNHVMYRVTPIYNGNDLLPCGVQMEGYSVEDKGEGISFNVYCYNVQPGVTIDYASGRSCRAGESLPSVPNDTDPSEEYNGIYILNTSSKKIHRSDCANAANISTENKEEFDGDLLVLFDEGYTYCGVCLKDAQIPESTPAQTPNETPSEIPPDTKPEPQPETKPNTQPENKPNTQPNTQPDTSPSTPSSSYVLNTDSKKIHYPSCYHAGRLSASKRQDYTGDISELLENGYTKCKVCFK